MPPGGGSEAGGVFREPRNWADHWLDWAVEVEMPAYVQKQYQYILGAGAGGAASEGKMPEFGSRQESGKGAAREDSIETRLAIWRQEKNLSQAEAAARLGMTQSYYSLIERRQRKLTDETRRKIEAMLASPE